MHEVALLGAVLANEPEALGGVEEIDLPGSCRCIWALFAFWNAQFDLISIHLFEVGRIGWCVHDHAVLVHISEHIFKATTGGVRLALFLASCFFLLLLLALLFLFALVE